MIPEQDAEKLVVAPEYLRDQGMELELLRDLHHNPKRTESFARAIAYRRAPPLTGYDEPNITYHRRLLFVAAEHWRTGRPFDRVVSEAKEIFFEPVSPSTGGIVGVESIFEHGGGLGVGLRK